MDCGCEIEWDGATDAHRKAYIVYCPLHEAAAEMREVLGTIENDGKQVPPWLWSKIQIAKDRADGKTECPDCGDPFCSTNH